MIGALSFALMVAVAPAEADAVPPQAPGDATPESAPPVPRPVSEYQPSVRQLPSGDPNAGERLPGSSPAPAQQPNYGTAPPPQTAPAQPAPAPQPPAAVPPPAYARPSAGAETAGGIAFVVTAPVVYALGFPLSIAGNNAWRKGCGPNTPTDVCARGSTQSILAHTGTGLLYVTGMVFAGVGGRKLGKARAIRDREAGIHGTRGSGLTTAGAVVLPLSLVGAGMARLFYWLPTPECEEWQCVKFYQQSSTLTVGGLAVVAGVGALMLGYGMGYNQQSRRSWSSMTLAPAAGRGYAGFNLSGRF